jgi:hypothetical protein
MQGEARPAKTICRSCGLAASVLADRLLHARNQSWLAKPAGRTDGPGLTEEERDQATLAMTAHYAGAATMPAVGEDEAIEAVMQAGLDDDLSTAFDAKMNGFCGGRLTGSRADADDEAEADEGPTWSCTRRRGPVS